MAKKRNKKPKEVSKTSPENKFPARSSKNRILLGVFGGLAEYFNADPMHVRMAWWAFIIVVGLAVGAVAYALLPTALTILAILYVIAYLLMNERPAD